MADNTRDPFEGANESQDRFSRNFRENTEFLRDAFTSLGFQIQSTIENAIDSSEKLTFVSKKIAESYNKDIFNAIKGFNRNLDQSITLQLKAQQGLLTQKDIQNARIAIEAKTEAIRQRINILQNSEVKLTRAQKTQLEKLTSELTIQESLATQQLEAIEATNKAEQDKITTLGKTGKVLRDNLDAIDKSGTLSKVFKGDISETFSKANLLKLSLIAIAKGVFDASEQMASFRKETGISYSNSLLLAGELRTVALTSNDAFITSAKLAKSFTDLSSEFGSIANTSGQTLETFTNLTQRLGLGNKEAAQLTLLAKTQGDNTEVVLDNVSLTVDKLNAQKGTGILLKQVFGDISSASKSIVVSLGMNPNLLAEAATEARQLGLNLQQVDKIAESLLQFESSITNELKAELLINKDINLEQARLYALTNDITNLTKEIGKNQEIIDTFATGNRIQQQAIAEAMGMSREEMAQMVYQQQALDIGAEGVREKFGEQAYEQLKARSAAEKFQDTLTKIQDIVGSLGVLFAPVLDAFAFLAEHTAAAAVAMGVLASISLGRTIAGLTVMAIQAGILSAGAITANAAITFGVGIAAVGAAVAIGLGILANAKQEATQDITTMDDGVIPSGYGNTIIKKGKNTIALNNSDQTAIVAGTNLGGGGNDAMIQEFREMKNILSSILAKDSNFYLDSNKFNSGLKTARIGIK
jgi:hypothetical protein